MKRFFDFLGKFTLLYTYMEREIKAKRKTEKMVRNQRGGCCNTVIFGNWRSSFHLCLFCFFLIFLQKESETDAWDPTFMFFKK